MNKQDVLDKIKQDSDELWEAIGEDLKPCFELKIDNLSVELFCEQCGIHVTHWTANDSSLQWQVFQGWKARWDLSPYVNINNLKNVDRSDHEQLREVIQTMIAEVEAWIELNPKPAKWYDRAKSFFLGGW